MRRVTIVLFNLGVAIRNDEEADGAKIGALETIF